MRLHGSTISVQNVRTPKWLLGSVALTWGPIELDVAATKKNAVATRFYTRRDNGVAQHWIVPPGSVAWANPPYERLSPWVERALFCSRHLGTDVVMLVLASVGANWWREHVDGNAEVVFISPRVKFIGHATSFPRDLAVLRFGP